MTLEEFSNQFDLLFNNVTSNQAPGLNEWEKSVFLTKAEKEIVKNHFTATSKGNNIGQGFDDSALRQADFSMLMKTDTCTPAGSNSGGYIVRFTYNSGNTVENDESSVSLSYDGSGTPTWEEIGTNIHNVTYDSATDPARVSFSITTQGTTTTYLLSPNEWTEQVDGTVQRIQQVARTCIDSRSEVFTFPSDVFIVINEAITAHSGKNLQVVPLRYDEYLRLMSKPFKRPVKNQAWRLINTGSGSDKYVEIIVGYQDSVEHYYIRYIRTPKPIILSPLDGLSIDGYYGTDTNGDLVTETASGAVSGIECELDPILHEDILQRAVELAKVAWTANGQENAQLVMQAGQRSE